MDALIVTDWDDTDWDGIPDMIPVVEFSKSSKGRDPDDSWSRWTVGAVKND